MATRESRADMGRRRGEEITRAALTELRTTRITLGVAQDALAASLECSQAEISNIERLKVMGVSLIRISEIAALLGLEPSVTFHPVGQPLRDKGHQALIHRLTDLLAPAWAMFREAHFPNPGDPRFWDLLLRLPAQLVGVEAETRVRDLQALVRRMRDRGRTGGVDCLLLVLSDSAVNRRVVDDLRAALGADFRASPRDLLQALRAGNPLPGSGVVLL